MKTRYHIEITRRSLEEHFSKNALNQVIKANIKQDRLHYQFKHDHIHFDGNAFDSGFLYISQQKEHLFNAIKSENYFHARKALGRITHSWQDFYSHSNYVNLWLSKFSIENPQLISHDDETIINHPDLTSGINYGVFEFVAMIPHFSKFIRQLMPIDSHAHMNLDSPADSKYFEYVYWAAFYRTNAVIENIMYLLKEEDFDQVKINHFKGK